jgi:hypothetical protein
MNYIEAPNSTDSALTSLFLAGGITDCPDHQAYICDKLKDLNITVFNPRRKNFPIHDPNAAYAQIKWEYDHLKEADMISFWFCKETMCPIVLYELGSWNKTQKPIAIGMDPEYSRRQDVEIQTRLIRPEVPIVYSIDDLSNEIFKMYDKISSQILKNIFETSK